MLFWLMSDVIESRKYKMAAVKPEVLIAKPIYKIATPFQRLTPILGVHQLSGTIENTAGRNRKSEFKDGGRQIGSTYISAYILDINAVPTAKPPFSGSSNSMGLLRIRLRYAEVGYSIWRLLNRK